MLHAPTRFGPLGGLETDTGTVPRFESVEPSQAAKVKASLPVKPALGEVGGDRAREPDRAVAPAATRCAA